MEARAVIAHAMKLGVKAAAQAIWFNVMPLVFVGVVLSWAYSKKRRKRR